MKKYFIVADVHGFYDEMMLALKNKGFDIDNSNHILVSLGDLLDRGTQPKECLDFVNQLPTDRKILIKGNHERLMELMIERGFPYLNDISNGTLQTALMLTGIKDKDNHDAACRLMSDNEAWNKYISSCQYFAEIGDNIFVHGWIPCVTRNDWGKPLHDEYKPNWRNSSKEEWEDATWFNGMDVWSNGVKEPGKTIWCGHWHTSWGHYWLHEDSIVEFNRDGTHQFEKFTPFKDDGICAMDACTAHSGFVNCETLEID